ncbi:MULTISPECIES: TMEM175 family protein [Microbacterium]|uniref:TMEM175 family protein n=1 Tax=Microbacterium TaxID=33882 RepID=UPI0027829CCC|nr:MULTISPECIES: TMEM175 family protein [Microbacterium]MDQ1083047.1 putative membrane protein [Microbacterium sp. SORGH_AS_0344]MDQ1171682.1 putative membrane protein [Microbacterium proteolyticum]
MIRRRSHPEASVSARRTEAFTDGVFAIAATLLVLGLTDQSLGSPTTDADLARGLRDLAHPVFSFVISFLILCVMWMTHVRQFEWIVRIDDTGMWINNIRLLLVVLVPFTSSLDTTHSDLLLGRILLPVNFFLAIVLGWVQWSWAVRSGAITDLTAADARRLGRANLSAVILSGLAMLLSPLVGSVAFLLFAFDGLLTRLLRGADSPAASLAGSDPGAAGDVRGRG